MVMAAIASRRCVETNGGVCVCDSYAASVGAAHFQTSAKTNRGLDEVFNHLASSKSSESVVIAQCMRPSYLTSFSSLVAVQ